MKCVDCGEPVIPGQTSSFREVLGWEKIRMHGGANAIVLRKETGKLMCSGCGERRKLNHRRGLDDGQGTLM